MLHKCLTLQTIYNKVSRGTFCDTHTHTYTHMRFRSISQNKNNNIVLYNITYIIFNSAKSIFISDRYFFGPVIIQRTWNIKR